MRYVIDQVTTRRLRIVKYRGSPHGLNEYPFMMLHISTLLRQVHEFQPQIMVLEPVSSFGAGSTPADLHGMLMRLRRTQLPVAARAGAAVA